MSSMRRSIARGIAKKRGTFEAQKPLRDRSRVSFKDSIMHAFMSTKHVEEAKGDKKFSFTDFVTSIFGRRAKEAN